MFGPPIGGKLIDKFGPKPVMMGGLSVAAAGFLFLAFVSLNSANAILLIVGLSIMGLGMGFAMGAPTNYMVLENTSPTESGAAIATIALVQSSGHHRGTSAAARFCFCHAGRTGLLPHAAVRGGVLHYFPRVHGVLPQEIRKKPPAPGPAQNVAG